MQQSMIVEGKHLQQYLSLSFSVSADQESFLSRNLFQTLLSNFLRPPASHVQKNCDMCFSPKHLAKRKTVMEYMIALLKNMQTELMEIASSRTSHCI